ncbi:hypothetical protein D3C80_1198690 [compost metagenome]
MAAIQAPGGRKASNTLPSITPMPQANGKDSRKASTIATPPPLGVGTSWELRSFGTSMRLRLSA